MKAAALTAKLPKRYRRTTDSSHGLPVADNALDRDFATALPDETWASDISYVWTAEGRLYLAVVIDVFSRRVVGWAGDGHMRTGLALDALAHAYEVQYIPAELGAQGTPPPDEEEVEQILSRSLLDRAGLNRRSR